MTKSDAAGKWSLAILYSLPALITLLYIIYLSGLIGNSFLAVHDSPLFINNEKLSEQIGLLWNSNSFGSPNYIPQAINYFAYILNLGYLKLFQSIKAGQLASYFLVINFIWYLAWYSFNSLLVLLGENNAKVNGFIGSYFFTFNLYMIVSWHGGTIDSLFFCYAIFPLVVLEVCKLLLSNGHQKINITTAILFGLCAYSGPLFLSALIACFGSFFLIAIGGKRWVAIQKVLQFLILTLIISLLFLPLFALFIFFGDPFPKSEGLAQPYYFSNLGISGLFRLYFDWTINGFWNGRFFHSYYPYYNNGIISACAIGLWFYALYALLKNIKHSKFGNFFLWLITVLVVSLFLAKATQPPFGIINELFYKYIPFFSMFRTPDTKFGLIVSCVLSFGVTYALSHSGNQNYKRAIFLCIFLQTAPFFTSIPIIEVRKGDQYERKVSLPDEYIEISSLVNDLHLEGAILMYPGTPYADFDYLNGSGLNGQDMLGALISRPVIYDDGWILNNSKNFYKTLIANPDQSDFGSSSIRFVLIRKDVLKQALMKKESDQFSHNPQLELLISNKIGNLYRVKNSAYRGEVFHGNPSNNLIEYKKINSTFYTLNQLNTDSGQLILNQSFHPGWKLCPIPTHSQWITEFTSLFQIYIQVMCPTAISIHKPYLKVFNAWEITPISNPRSQYALIFSPQPFWNLLKIFIYGFILIITAVMIANKIKEDA